MSLPSAYRKPVGGSYLGLLRQNRDFRLLYVSALISLAGDWFLTVALLDQVLELTGKATMATLISLCMNLPVFLVTPWAGALADKLDRRKLMIAVDAGRALAALLPLLSTSPATLVFSYLGVCLLSLGAAVFDPAVDAAIPNLVAPEDLARSNVLFGSAWGMMMTVGAALGGVVTVYFGRTTSFVVNSLSFALSALLLAFIRTPFSEQAAHAKDPALHPPRPRVTLRESVRETWAYARQNQRVLALLLAKAGFGVAGGLLSLLSLFGREIFHGGAEGIARMLVARGLGALLGPFLMLWLIGSGLRQQLSIGWFEMTFGLGYTMLCLSSMVSWSPGTGMVVGLVAVFIAHSGGGATWQASVYGLQRETPDALRGRVFAADYGLYTLMASIACVAAGLLADRFGVIKAALGLALVTATWPVFWWAWARKLFREPSDGPQ